MAGKKTRLEPSRRGARDPGEWAREINDRLKAEGRTFDDSTESVRADRAEIGACRG
jgi:hypothetical protein